MTVTLLVLGTLILIGVYIYVYKVKVYVHSKTGYTFLFLKEYKLKCPITGDWYDVVIYKRIKDGKYYVMEKNEFFKEFFKIKYSEYGKYIK